MLETVLFYLFSLGIIISAIGVISSRSAVYSVLCLVAAMAFMACLFALLKAYLVAIILLLVYAGAILVLFLFVVMLVDARHFRLEGVAWRWGRLGAGLLGALVFAECVRVIQTISSSAPSGLTQGNAKPIGLLLFSRYLLPFELTSLLLLAAVVSVVALAKKEAR